MRDLHEWRCSEIAACARCTFATWTSTTCALWFCGLDWATTFPAAATAGATAKAVTIAPVMAMVLMPRSLLVVLMQAA